MSTDFGSGSPVIRPFVIIINLSFPLKNYELSLFNNGKGGFFYNFVHSSGKRRQVLSENYMELRHARG